MSWKCLRNTLREARKPHDCWLCDKLIAPGEVYIYRVGVDQSELVEMHMHVTCEEATSDWDAMDWETFSQGDLETHINQEQPMSTGPSSVSFNPHLFFLEKINQKLAEVVEPSTEYQVISSIDPIKLAQHVERAMQMGWRCQGGISMAMLTSVDPVWAQAMVH